MGSGSLETKYPLSYESLFVGVLNDQRTMLRVELYYLYDSDREG